MDNLLGEFSKYSKSKATYNQIFFESGILAKLLSQWTKKETIIRMILGVRTSSILVHCRKDPNRISQSTKSMSPKKMWGTLEDLIMKTVLTMVRRKAQIGGKRVNLVVFAACHAFHALTQRVDAAAVLFDPSFKIQCHNLIIFMEMS